MEHPPRPVRLTVYQPNLAPLELDLQAPLITLGRASDCTIPIRDRYLSRRHAEIAFASGEWIVRDCGSVNGTLLNGTRIDGNSLLHPGDRITLGDSEVVFDDVDSTAAKSQLIPLDGASHARNLAIPMREAVDEHARTGVLASLALQFIEDRPMNELFEFFLDRVGELLHPSRAAIALLEPDGKTFGTVRLRRRDDRDSTELLISRTLLGEVVEERKVVSFFDAANDDRLARAESIVAQRIRSAVCAPLLVGDAVLGVLYIDFLADRGAVTEEDVRLIAQIARFAAVKLETTRLREEALAKARLDDELRTAYAIQKKLLPTALPEHERCTFAAVNHPCRTVSGDYYDVVARPDGRIYFVVADVSGKGITAAIVMSSVATAFNIFTRTDPTPADLVRELNATLAPKTSPTKFVTMVVGVLDPVTGVVDYTNAGHVSPLVVRRSGIEELSSTDMIVGLFADATYRTQRTSLKPGEALVLFTDGVTEAENGAEDQLGIEPVCEALALFDATTPEQIVSAVEATVMSFAGNVSATDDLTVMALQMR